MNNKKILFWVLWIYDVQDELLSSQITNDLLTKTPLWKRYLLNEQLFS